MNTQQAYDIWSDIYDTNINKTRDLEAKAIREILSGKTFKRCLEIGSGTGKNTEWLITKADEIVCVDLSEAMLNKAQAKIVNSGVTFTQADITREWDFAEGEFDLITFSLMLEHIEDLQEVFNKAAAHLTTGGYIYIGELHPFKQYSGSKARFETEAGQQIVTCFNHHVSDFVQAGKKTGLALVEVQEYFDDDDRTSVPRILTLLMRKNDG
ncbi:class I SAM-dependent DNA methyltransferase [Daejeonella lutea]|uniref:Methyltransferase domain-containing protein n=1 Tax=Daejeonella lutea TaxID=572036 RepID=A0A1T5A8Y7_9SPHI|nr:class I SAM-dependent methyltransferase [Daejeonella lutea]SKB31462.1 Methyltransferase domain-containing protein [Daejeonella lutea]